MHELSIATELISQVLKHMKLNRASRIHEVEVEVGIMRLVVPEAMRTAWAVVTAGTPAEESKLKLTDIPISAECLDCGEIFDPEMDNFICPKCGEANVVINSGNDIILKSLTADIPEGGSGQ